MNDFLFDEIYLYLIYLLLNPCLRSGKLVIVYHGILLIFVHEKTMPFL